MTETSNTLSWKAIYNQHQLICFSGLMSVWDHCGFYEHLGFHLCKTLTVLQRPCFLSSLYFTFMLSLQYFTGQWSTWFKAPTTDGILSTHCRRSKYSPKRLKASLHSSGKILFHCLLGRVTVGSLWGTDTAKGSGPDHKHLLFTTCWKFLKIRGVPALRDMGEGEHQCSCFRVGEVEGSVVSALCCACFDLHSSSPQQMPLSEEGPRGTAGGGDRGCAVTSELPGPLLTPSSINTTGGSTWPP